MTMRDETQMMDVRGGRPTRCKVIYVIRNIFCVVALPEMWWWKYCNYMPAPRKQFSRAKIKGKDYVSQICVRIGNSEQLVWPS